jgi:peptidoglycan/xylan/chitin deacetylase (PgdA/CDA1 family)
LETSITFDDISPKFLSTAKFRLILDLLKEIDISCTFFVVPGPNGAYLSIDAEFKSCLKDALSLGHEVSLHGHVHCKNEFGYISIHPYSIPLSLLPLPSLRTQQRSIEEASKVLGRFIGKKPIGFRAPGYQHNFLTFRALSNLGFKYDSSETVFKPAHSTNFRVFFHRSFQPHYMFGLLEIPVIGDYTDKLKTYNFLDSIERANRDFDLVSKQRGGVFVMNCHPAEIEMKLMNKFFRAFYKKLARRTEFLKLSEIAH